MVSTVVMSGTPLRVTALHNRPFGGHRASTLHAKRSQLPRRHLVVRADEAERSKQQNTVGDLDQDQVQRALERQLKLSETKRNGGNSDSAAAQQQDEAAASDEAALPLTLQPASEEERQQSLQALKDMRDRVPLMAQSTIDFAMERLLAQGNAGGNSSGGGEAGASTSSGTSSEDGPSPAAPASGGGSGSSSGGGKQGKYGADATFDDGALLFTADSLSAVSYDELRP